MRAMVMPLQWCGYTVMLTSLRESFMEEGGRSRGGGGGERNGEEQKRERERDKIEHRGNTAANASFLSLRETKHLS